MCDWDWLEANMKKKGEKMCDKRSDEEAGGGCQKCTDYKDSRDDAVRVAFKAEKKQAEYAVENLRLRSELDRAWEELKREKEKNNYLSAEIDRIAASVDTITEASPKFGALLEHAVRMAVFSRTVQSDGTLGDRTGFAISCAESLIEAFSIADEEGWGIGGLEDIVQSCTDAIKYGYGKNMIRR